MGFAFKSMISRLSIGVYTARDSWVCREEHWCLMSRMIQENERVQITSHPVPVLHCFGRHYIALCAKTTLPTRV